MNAKTGEKRFGKFANCLLLKYYFFEHPEALLCLLAMFYDPFLDKLEFGVQAHLFNVRSRPVERKGTVIEFGRWNEDTLDATSLLMHDALSALTARRRLRLINSLHEYS